MGGIGKTSLAKYVFHLHSRTFDKSSFIEGINLRCTRNYNGLLDVQKQLSDVISKKNKLPVQDTCEYTSKIEKALGRVKVFLVLDDIDSLDQLDALLGDKGIHPGSKIIRNIRTVLQLSFDSLPFPNDKELFKHIACFFVGIDRKISEKILKACHINTISGIPNLIERCLLRINQWNNSLMMHQLLQEMGKAIVREESPDEPWNRSRLWCHDESFKVLKRKKGTGKLKGLVLDTRMLEKEKSCDLKTDAFSNMDNLMILHLNYVQLSGSYEDFPEELIWLRMHGFPLKSIPSDIPMEKLVVLDMTYSNIESFGTCCTSCNPQQLEGGQKVIGSCSKDKRVFGSLKILDLSFCEQLRKLGGFYKLPTLESLIVRNCKRLTEICESLEECVQLVHIDLSYCVKLEKLPTAIRKLKKVETLLLDGCNISSFVEAIPSGLNSCVISSPSSLVRLSLANTNLTNESFPKDLSCLSRLKYLRLDANPIVSMLG